jgi:hypothetical protein
MNARIDKLEQDVAALKVELASLHENGAKAADLQVLKVTFDMLREELAACKLQLESLHETLMALKARVDILASELAALSVRFDTLIPTLANKDDLKNLEKRFEIDVGELEKRVDIRISNLATKAELERLGARLLGWMFASVLTLFIVLGGLQYTFYTNLTDNLGNRLKSVETRLDLMEQRADQRDQKPGQPQTPSK